MAIFDMRSKEDLSAPLNSLLNRLASTRLRFGLMIPFVDHGVFMRSHACGEIYEQVRAGRTRWTFAKRLAERFNWDMGLGLAS